MMRNYFYSFFQNTLDDKEYMQYNTLLVPSKPGLGEQERWKTLSINPGITMTGTEL